MTAELWPFFAYLGASIVVLAGMLGLSYLLGQRHHEAATGDPYESGILPTGSARVRFDVTFYLVAMFFVIFDLEAVFIFLWAVALRKVGWMGYIDIAVFIGVLVIALAYLWRLGALDWGSVPRTRRNVGR
ncbi:MAG TPA: NADH-quinone oxidoreductase subunit A [Dehalococcoidia bacterium]|nr:NADH-quinone oxidoreductase subunit A [Dehalococcoidia bacterium]